MWTVADGWCNDGLDGFGRSHRLSATGPRPADRRPQQMPYDVQSRRGGERLRLLRLVTANADLVALGIAEVRPVVVGVILRS